MSNEKLDVCIQSLQVYDMSLLTEVCDSFELFQKFLVQGFGRLHLHWILGYYRRRTPATQCNHRRRRYQWAIDLARKTGSADHEGQRSFPTDRKHRQDDKSDAICESIGRSQIHWRILVFVQRLDLFLQMRYTNNDQSMKQHRKDLRKNPGEE